MYKFKFDPPQDHRHSTQQPKHDHIALLNTLDKCTQILREDRLWLRNQIKNNNQDVIALFKQLPRSIQLQTLQIKLRKYVQNVKNKIKKEQLSKFRQTLQSQGSVHTIVESKPSHSKRMNQSISRSHLRSNPSLQLHKTTNFRPNKSQQHLNNNLKSTASFKNFQDVIKYKFNHDIIEQRQSQNVTSARLARQEDYPEHRPLQEINYSSSQNNYTPSFNNFFGKKSDYQTKAITSYEPEGDAPWEFQKKAKLALYDIQPEVQEQKKERQIEDINIGFASRFHKQFSEQDSIFDKHFPQSDKVSDKVSVQHDHSQAGSVHDFKSMQFGLSRKDEVKELESHNQSRNNFELKQSNFSNTFEDKVKKEYKNQNDESLFTPQDLLNECRSFLKNRSSSTKKIEPNLHFEEFLKSEPLKIEQKTNSKVSEQSECIFSRNNQQQPSVNMESSMQEEKKEEESYMFPEIQKSLEQSLEQTLKKEEGFVYPHFQTFANSSQKICFDKAMSPPQHPNLAQLIAPKEKQVPFTLPSNFSIEDLVEDLMELTEMNPFITIQNLSQYIKLQKESKALSSILQSELALGKEEEVCLTAIAQKLDYAISQYQQKGYLHNDTVINSVYNLLDIDQKGHIARQDVDSFLLQIAEAEVQNYQEVSQELNRLFDGADFTNEQRLTYWHCYLVKNSEEFEKVSQLLGQFQFQIERQA